MAQDCSFNVSMEAGEVRTYLEVVREMKVSHLCLISSRDQVVGGVEIF